MNRKYLVMCGLAVAAALGTVPAATGANLVLNGNFSGGNTGFTSGYALTTQTPDLFENAAHGIYAILPIGSVAGQSAYGDWTNVSVDPTGGNGNVFAADGATNANTTVWSETVSVTPNTQYIFSYYAAEISNACCSNAVFVPTIDGSNGASLTASASWQQGTFTWNSGSNTTASLSLTDTNINGPYNDFVLTDIAFATPIATAPEPGTWALISLSGLALLCAFRKVRTRATSH